MSINGINGINGTGGSGGTGSTGSTGGAARIAAPPAEAAATAGAARAAVTETAPAEVKQAAADGQQRSVHFPWLSRLSAELEAASNQRARFPTQIMGDHVDRKV